MALDSINVSKDLPLGRLQQEVHEWISKHGVRYFNELTNLAQLTEEVGEVARIIARRYGEQSEKESDKVKDLGEELSDVFFCSTMFGQSNRHRLASWPSIKK